MGKIHLTILCVLVNLSFVSPFALAQSAVENKLADNVNVVPLNYSYEDDYDSAKFRMRIYKMNQDEILSTLSLKKDSICKSARASKQLFLDSQNSAEYVVKVLKSAGVIDAEDKDYKFKSANYMWDFYLAFRNFVEIDRAFKGSDIDSTFNNLPDGTIVLVSRHCVPNGAVAISCNNRLYTKRFPNLKTLIERLKRDNNPKCQIGNGIKFIVESGRFK